MPYILFHTYAIYIPYGYLYYLYNCYTTYGINNDFMYCGLFILVTRPFFYNGPQCAIGVRQNSWTQQHTFYQHIHCRIESIMYSVFDQPINPGTYSRGERVAACFFFHGSEVCYLHIVQKVTWYVKWTSTLTIHLPSVKLKCPTVLIKMYWSKPKHKYKNRVDCCYLTWFLSKIKN